MRLQTVWASFPMIFFNLLKGKTDGRMNTKSIENYFLITSFYSSLLQNKGMYFNKIQ